MKLLMLSHVSFSKKLDTTHRTFGCTGVVRTCSLLFGSGIDRDRRKRMLLK